MLPYYVISLAPSKITLPKGIPVPLPPKFAKAKQCECKCPPCPNMPEIWNTLPHLRSPQHSAELAVAQ